MRVNSVSIHHGLPLRVPLLDPSQYRTLNHYSYLHKHARFLEFVRNTTPLITQISLDNLVSLNMPKCMGFEAYITDEKWNPLPEYKVEIFGEEKMAMCYIASNVNQVLVY